MPTGDESTMLLTVEDFESMAKRAVPPRIGKPLVAVDLGGSRAWSPLRLALYRNGRLECRATRSRAPDYLRTQEDRDLQFPGERMRRLRAIADAVMTQAEGLRVPKAKSTLIADASLSDVGPTGVHHL